MSTIEWILWVLGATALSAFWYVFTLHLDSQKRAVRWDISQLFERRRMLLVPAASIAVLAVFVGVWSGSEIPETFIARILVFTSALFAIAALDYKYHIVPNRALLILLIMRVVIIPFEVSAGFAQFAEDLRAELITGAVFFGFFLLMRFFQRGGLGMGDVKLLALMPLLYGPTLAVSSLVASFLIIFVVSLTLLGLKRKKMEDGLPLAPSVLIGSIAVILLLSLEVN